MSNRLTIKGQVTIPKAVRDFLGLQEGGSSVEFTINDDGSVTVQLQRKKSGDSNAQLEDVGGVITLNKGNGWQTTVDNLVPGYTYSVRLPRFRSPRSFTLRRVGTARRRYLIGCPSEWDESSAVAKAECCRLTF